MGFLLVLILSILVSLVVLVVLFALVAFMLTVAASLSNVDNLGFWKACLIVGIEASIAVPLISGGYFLLDQAGYSLAHLGNADAGEFFLQVGVWGGILLVIAATGVALCRFLIPTGVLRAVRIWVLRALVLTLVGALLGGFTLVGLAVYQLWVPRVA